MAKNITGFPAVNAAGDTRSVYSLINILSDQISVNNDTVVAEIADHDAVDGTIILMTTGAADKTSTLPLAADSLNARITLKKVDAGVGNAIFAGNGAELIEGSNLLTLVGQWTYSTVQCDGTGWVIVAQG